MLDLADLGLEPDTNANDEDAKPVRSAPRRRVLGLGLDECLAAAVPEHLIVETAWRTVVEVHTDHGHLDMPAHVALALAPNEDGPSVDGLRRLVPTAREQTGLKRSLLRLAHLHARGVPEARIVDEVMRAPAVFVGRYGLYGDGMPDGERGTDWVQVPPGKPGRSREADIIALAVVIAPSRYTRSGWTRDGYLVSRSDAVERGWVEA